MCGLSHVNECRALTANHEVPVFIKLHAKKKILCLLLVYQKELQATNCWRRNVTVLQLKKLTKKNKNVLYLGTKLKENVNCTLLELGIYICEKERAIIFSPVSLNCIESIR
jgi:hypothetical protein